MPTHRAQIFLSAAVLTTTPQLKQSLSSALANDTIAQMSDEELRRFLNPTPDDYVMVPFRALSAADDVQHNMFNFAHDGGAALKAALPLFNDLMVLKDHNMTVDNWVGKTQDAYWDESTPNTPPGVNFMIKLDTKADPKLARGVLSGMVTSGSMTIEFDYEQSHPKMKPWDFMMNLGELVDGKRVQALVTKITRNYEYSLVWQGADTNAKKINPDGSISRPGMGLNTEEQPLKKLATLLKLAETATEDEIAIALSALSTKLAETETAKSTAETSATTLTATIAIKDAELATKTAEVVTLNAKVVTLTTEKATSDAELTTLKADKATFATLLTARRAEALRLYNLANGDKAMESMRVTIQNAPLDTTESFIQAYGAEVDKLMPLECSKCHSSEVNRRKSQQSASGAADDKQGQAKESWNDKRLKSAISSIHAE